MSQRYQHPSKTSQEADLRRRKALADALAGVVATIVSLWAFYPMDVLKTNIQAGKNDAEEDAATSSSSSEKKKASVWTLVTLTTPKSRAELVSSLFRGLHLKTLHAASSSFCYFYLYSWIASWWRAQQRHSDTNNSNNSHTPMMSPAVRLSLSALAAALNTCLTLPLDVLASNHQTKQTYSKSPVMKNNIQEEKESPSLSEHHQQQQKKMEDVWNQLSSNTPQSTSSSSSRAASPTTRDVANQHDGDLFYSCCMENQEQQQPQQHHSGEEGNEEEEKKNDEENHSLSSNSIGRVTVTVTAASSNPLVNNNTKHILPPTNTAQESTPPCSKKASNSTFTLAQIGNLWKGLYPSLLLCSNPSIHYTAFDMAKSHLLQSRQLANPNNTNTNLSMTEAFLLGLLAKFCATMATYPLIRTKVMLMVTSSNKSSQHKNGMLQTLCRLYQNDGIRKGWYKGCGVQLLHTVLKSALLMMVKERIAMSTQRMLLPPQSLPSAQ